MPSKRTDASTIVGAGIKEFFNKNGISQQEAAQRLGISQAAISARLSGTKPFGHNAASKWAEEFGFRKGWLLTGEGAMLDKDTVSQTIEGNNGLAIQQSGNGTINASGDAGFFTKLCSDLMRQIMERDQRICCLEREIEQLKKGNGSV